LSKIFRRWIYHATEEPKVISSNEFEDYKKEGWADSPAEFLNKKDVGIDEEKLDSGDFQETMKAQQVMDSIEGVKDSLNGALNLDNMTKVKLESYARKHLGIELDRRKKKSTLIDTIRENLHGDS
jgi:hypothetical protein